MTEKCIACDIEKEGMRSIAINMNNGFMLTSFCENICNDCFKQHHKITKVGTFLMLKDGLYHDGYGFNSYNKVYNEYQLDSIFNPEFYELLEHFNNI